MTQPLSRQVISSASQFALRLLSLLDRKLHDSSLYGLELQDPYSAIATVRARGPILRSWTYQGWLVTGFDEVQALLRHEKMSNDLRNNKFMVRLVKSAVGDERVPTIDNPTMLNQDPPDHTRLRKLVSQEFTNKYVQSLAPVIDDLCESLLRQDEAEFDFVAAIARPLPAIVIAKMLGVPDTDMGKIHRWSADLLSITRFDQPEMMRRATGATLEMDAYFEQLANLKMISPGNDLVSALLQAGEAQGGLTRSELYSVCLLILVAGHETTTRLLGNGLLRLAQHPEQYELLRQSPELLDNAIEEMLRFDPPLQFTPRLVKEDFSFAGCSLKRGQATLLSIAGANHDPSANEDPEQFDITRRQVRHISFGYGPHLCLGMSLARLEAKIVFREILRRYEKVKLVDPVPDWSRDFFFRGQSSLNLRVILDEKSG